MKGKTVPITYSFLVGPYGPMVYSENGKGKGGGASAFNSLRYLQFTNCQASLI